MKTNGISIFAQTLLLLLASLIATQIVVITLIIALPQPRPQFIGMSDIASSLSGKPQPRRDHRKHSGDDQPLLVRTLASPPAPVKSMISNGPLTQDLAERIGVPASRVRLYFKPDQSGFFLFSRREPGEVVPMRRGEALFFNTVSAAYDSGSGWRAIQSDEPPFLSEWQRRLILLFGASILVLLPFGWFFARRLSNPIRRFALAADHLGRDASGPSVTVEGPRELRTTAVALNAMQTRIGDYLRERTAMIGAIAHDLRTPLSRIAFRIENAPDAIREPVQRDIEQMRVMIAETMNFVKNATRPAEHVRLSLQMMIEKLVTQSREMGHDVSGTTQSPGHMMGDPVALERLFQNLIDNALAYGSRAEISLRTTDRGHIVAVQDNGPGLPPEMLETVLDPFTRGEPSRNRETGGVGLGLAIARAIALDHQGELTLRNGREGGLIASVTFASQKSGLT